uniref:Ig-like domain-containing protein n=1 Tax=Arion vulgaris TaxID=1028688 RepID=A0A0B6ZWH3_9EUPU
MRTNVCCWVTFFMIVVFAQDVKTRRRQIWGSVDDETSPLPQPAFRDTPDRVTFRQGQMAKLECSVESLGTKKVIWRRKSDPNPLTIGRRTFVDDERISVEHVPLGPDWHLIIKQVRLDDDGVYECQISSTDRDLRRYVFLTVKQSDNVLHLGPEINITGKTYVEKNQKIRLVCNATGADHSPDSLDWFLNGQKLATDVEKKMQVSLTDKTISSILEVEEADMDDAGIYVCRTSDLQIASTRVDVLNADTNNVKRGTEKDASGDKSDGTQSRQVKIDHGGNNNQAERNMISFCTTIILFLLSTILTNVHHMLPT